MGYINLATYPTAFFTPGGGEVQFLSTFKEATLLYYSLSNYMD